MRRPGKRFWLAVKLALAVAVAAGVGVQFARVLSNPQLADFAFTVRPGYLAASAVLYLTAHTVWGLFWWRLLRSQGVAVSPVAAVRAYFVSQFGKYVPGKVWVILLRVGLLRGAAGPAVVAVTATYETLTTMAAGAMLAAALAPAAAGNVYLLLGIAALPLGGWLFLQLGGRVAKRSQKPDARPLPNPPARLLLAGLLQAAAGWCLLGVSVGCAVRALHPAPPDWTADGFARDLAAVAVAYVVGFVVLVSPGGLGPREYLLSELLTPGFAGTVPAAEANALAVVVALVLRLVWTAAEVIVAGVCYATGKSDHAE